MSEKLRLFRKDVLVKSLSMNDINTGIIHIVSDSDKKEGANYFEVLDIANDVTEVKIGDRILLPYLEHTPPMDYNGIKCAITSEDKIMCVFED